MWHALPSSSELPLITLVHTLLTRSFCGALLGTTLPSALTPLFPTSVQPLCLFSRVKWDHVTQLLGRGLPSLAEVLSCAPNRNPLCFIAGWALGQDIALKEQPPSHAHKFSIRLAMWNCVEGSTHPNSTTHPCM